MGQPPDADHQGRAAARQHRRIGAGLTSRLTLRRLISARKPVAAPLNARRRHVARRVTLNTEASVSPTNRKIVRGWAGAEKKTEKKRVTLWRGVRAGTFPAPMELGPNSI